MSAILKNVLVNLERIEDKTRTTFHYGQYKLCNTCIHHKKGKDKDYRVICRSNKQPKLGKKCGTCQIDVTKTD